MATREGGATRDLRKGGRADRPRNPRRTSIGSASPVRARGERAPGTALSSLRNPTRSAPLRGQCPSVYTWAPETTLQGAGVRVAEMRRPTPESDFEFSFRVVPHRDGRACCSPRLAASIRASAGSQKDRHLRARSNRFKPPSAPRRPVVRFAKIAASAMSTAEARGKLWQVPRGSRLAPHNVDPVYFAFNPRGRTRRQPGSGLHSIDRDRKPGWGRSHRDGG